MSPLLYGNVTTGMVDLQMFFAHNQLQGDCRREWFSKNRAKADGERKETVQHFHNLFGYSLMFLGLQRPEAPLKAEEDRMLGQNIHIFKRQNEMSCQHSPEASLRGQGNMAILKILLLSCVTLGRTSVIQFSSISEMHILFKFTDLSHLQVRLRALYQ